MSDDAGSTDRSGRIRAVVVDDEPLARDCVRLALEREPDVEILAECRDGESAVRAILRHQPDLVFLDVQMPGLDGFGVIERIGVARMPPVVFVTAYEEYALRAFQVHAFDYVLKPFDDARFRDALEQARRRLRSDPDGDLTRRLSALLDDYRQVADATRGKGREGAPSRYVTRLTVRAQGRMRFVRVEEVDWFEAAGNYVRLHVGSATHLIRGTIRGLADQLDPSRFVRIHRSTIVNLERIREMQPWFGGDYVVILQDDERLRVGRAYRDRLLRPFL